MSLLVAACGASSAAPTPAPTGAPATAVTDAALIAVARAVMAPSGTLCDTHRDAAPSDANACPYTDRLKTRVNALYQQAWSGHANPSPVLSSGPPCAPSSPTAVAYFATRSPTGGVVSLVATCGTPAADASTSWQRLVILPVAGSLLVDDILVDRGHKGSFTSVYA